MKIRFEELEGAEYGERENEHQAVIYFPLPMRRNVSTAAMSANAKVTTSSLFIISTIFENSKYFLVAPRDDFTRFPTNVSQIPRYEPKLRDRLAVLGDA